MPKVIITAQVEDMGKWEEGFRTHGELFRRASVNKPIHFATADNNEVVVCFEPDDLDKFMGNMDTPENKEAMDSDGVRRDTVKIFVLNGEYDPG